MPGNFTPVRIRIAVAALSSTTPALPLRVACRRDSKQPLDGKYSLACGRSTAGAASRFKGLRVYALALVVMCAPVLAGFGTARAQSATWNGSGADWNTNANWSPATTPTDTAIFAGATLTISAAMTNINTLQFNAGALGYSFNISNGQFNINGAGVVNNSSNAPTTANSDAARALPRKRERGQVCSRRQRFQTANDRHCER
jgi:hypothetical protein